jgi:hypothetical protein
MATNITGFIDGVSGFRVLGSDHTGGGNKTAGDINGDGFEDLVIGAHYDSSVAFRAGQVAVVFGKADGFSGTLNFSDLDGSDGFLMDGQASGDFMGQIVSAAIKATGGSNRTDTDSSDT